MTSVELEQYARNCDHKIEELKKQLAEEESRKERILEELRVTSETAMKNDTVIGKYYYHPQTGAFQYVILKKQLEDNCEEISKEEFIEKTKEAMDGILELEASAIYLEGDGSTYEEIKPNKNRI